MYQDGPYIFIKEDVAEVITIADPFGGQTDATETQEIPFSQLPDHLFKVVPENTGDEFVIKHFSFKIDAVTDPVSTPCEYELPPKLLVTSDIEGNFYALETILLANKVIDKNGDWIFSTNHVLINGDLIDRSNNVLACLWLIFKLEAQAKEAGGAVHYLLGNHELMNFHSDFRYVHPKYTLSPGSFALYNALFTASSVLGKWIASKNSIERIGQYLFVHGGISKNVVEQRLSMKEINSFLQKSLYKQRNTFYYNDTDAVLLGANGPLWYRGMILKEYRATDFTEKTLDEIFAYFQANKMIVGHTVVPSFKKLYSGKLMAIDVLHPEYRGEAGVQALLIEGGKEFIVDENGDKKIFG